MRNQDARYLDQLRDYYAKHGVLPSFSGIGRLVGLKSTSAVSVMVSRLKEERFLASTADRRLQPGSRFFERSSVEVAVPAGVPQDAQEVMTDAVAIDRLLIDEPSRTVLIPVKGDSMERAGLLSGDTVVVKRGAPARSGDIVVARVDGEFTVKFLAEDNKGFYLKPGNEAYSDIRPSDELNIFGRVTGSFRRYK